MHRYYFLFIVVSWLISVCLLSGCTKILTKQEKSIHIFMDTVHIAIDENFINNYVVRSAVCENYFYGHNQKLNTIDVFDLKDKKALLNIPI